MNTKKTLFSIAVTATLFFDASQALGKETSAGPITVYGEATASCGSFVESKQNETQRYVYLAWLNGYLTGVNKYDSGVKAYNGSRDVKMGRDPQALMLWLENHCRNNPLDTFMQAVLLLQNELQK